MRPRSAADQNSVADRTILLDGKPLTKDIAWEHAPEHDALNDTFFVLVDGEKRVGDDESDAALTHVNALLDLEQEGKLQTSSTSAQPRS